MTIRIFSPKAHYQSISQKMRARRSFLLQQVVNRNSEKITILDVGGEQEFWEMSGIDFGKFEQVKILLLNLKFHSECRHDSKFLHVIGDARKLPFFASDLFDLVVSNSVIEHVGTVEDQAKAAAEIMRVGKLHFVQTPNRYFPIEPHFVFPFFQFFPIKFRIILCKYFGMGWYPRMKDVNIARRHVENIHLISRLEFKQLFPDSKIVDEQCLGLTKSFMAISKQ